MIAINTVFAAVHLVTGIYRGRIVSRKRPWPVMEARMLFILAMSRSGASDDRIAAALKRNRSTITKSRNSAESYLAHSVAFSEKLSKIESCYGE